MTIVWFSPAVVAFTITGSGRWLFDPGSEYRAAEWWKTKSFYCPGFNDNLFATLYSIERSRFADYNNWYTRANVLGGKNFPKSETNLPVYLVYLDIAVGSYVPLSDRLFYPQLAWAITPSRRMVCFTASNSFAFHGHSGVPSSLFSQVDEAKDVMPNGIFWRPRRSRPSFLVLLFVIIPAAEPCSPKAAGLVHSTALGLSLCVHVFSLHSMGGETPTSLLCFLATTLYTPDEIKLFPN